MAPFATDGKHLVRIGVPLYGFSPLRLDPDERFLERFHGVDERVRLEALRWGSPSSTTSSPVLRVARSWREAVCGPIASSWHGPVPTDGRLVRGSAQREDGTRAALERSGSSRNGWGAGYRGSRTARTGLRCPAGNTGARDGDPRRQPPPASRGRRAPGDVAYSPPRTRRPRRLMACVASAATPIAIERPLAARQRPDGRQELLGARAIHDPQHGLAARGQPHRPQPAVVVLLAPLDEPPLTSPSTSREVADGDRPIESARSATVVVPPSART